MSGGSYDYVSYKMDDAVANLRHRHADKPHVLALADLLERAGSVMHDIEWADSGDTSWDETLDAKVRATLAPGAEMSVVLRQAEAARAHLDRLIALAAGVL